jgi:hypothetical protein
LPGASQPSGSAPASLQLSPQPCFCWPARAISTQITPIMMIHPIPLILNTPLRNHCLIGNFHIIGTIWVVFNIRGMWLMRVKQWTIHPPVITSFIGGIQTIPKLGGVWLFYTYITRIVINYNYDYHSQNASTIR